MGLFFGHNQISGDQRFIFTIDTTKGTGTNFTLPLPSGYTYNFTVDWGDGNSSEITAYNDADITHTYSSGGVYQIIISGTCQGWSYTTATTGDRLKYISIDNWGNVGFIYIVNFLWYAINITTIPQEPFPYNVNNLKGAFAYTKANIPSNFLHKCTSTTNMSQLFQGANIPLYSDFLRYCVEVVDLSYLFYSVNLTTKNIPEDYFYYNSKVTKYSYIFNGSRNLILPTRLFNLSNLSIVTSFAYFMDVTATGYSPTGTIQDIWNYATSAISTDAFDQCTAITNYADIPTAWK